jgi:transcriptional regulator with XRE-family HTH domain
MSETRTLLGRQLSEARVKRGWIAEDVAKRTARQRSRIYEMESGRVNSTVDSLSEVGAALGLSLVFVPISKLDAALALSHDGKKRDPVPPEWRSAHDDLFIDDREIDDEDGGSDADR